MKCVVGNSDWGFSSFLVKHARKLNVPTRTQTSVSIRILCGNGRPLMSLGSVFN